MAYYLYNDDENAEDILANFNIKIDTLGSNNNFNIYLDLIMDSKKAFEFEVDNRWTMIFRKIQVEKPLDSQIIELEEVMTNPEY